MSDQYDYAMEKLDKAQSSIDRLRKIFESLKGFKFDRSSIGIYVDDGDIRIYMKGPFDEALSEARRACKIAFPDWTDSIIDMGGFGNSRYAIWGCKDHPEIILRYDVDEKDFPKKLMKKGCEWVESGESLTSKRVTLSCKLIEGVQ